MRDRTSFIGGIVVIAIMPVMAFLSDAKQKAPVGIGPYTPPKPVMTCNYDCTEIAFHGSDSNDPWVVRLYLGGDTVVVSGDPNRFDDAAKIWVNEMFRMSKDVMVERVCASDELVRQVGDAGAFCRVYGHQWRNGRRKNILEVDSVPEYNLNLQIYPVLTTTETQYRHCHVCLKNQEQQLEWKDIE